MITRSLQRICKSFVRTGRTALRPQFTLLRRHISAYVDAEDDRYIVVREQTSPDAAPMKFPGVWLRDNCQCEQCFHASSQSRSIDWDNFDVNVKPQTVETNAAAAQLQVHWNDKHVSSYDLNWLKERKFDTESTRQYLDSFYRPKTLHWCGADFAKITETFDFGDVLSKDTALCAWLQALAVRGVALIRNAPKDEGVVRQLAQRVGFIRKTTYGEEFIVQAKPGAKNYAYLSTPLPLHTDLPYYEYKPSVNLLHCLEQTKSEGGKNLLVDAFHIADRMRELYPDDFKILTDTFIDWNDIGSDGGYNFHNIWRAPVICRDERGNYTRINHSIPQRDSHFSVALEQVIPWYSAYARFVKMAREDAHSFKTQEGDVLTFNNIRLLHGRTGYTDTEQNSRYIVGAYLDWDIIYSRLRVLKTQAQA